MTQGELNRFVHDAHGRAANVGVYINLIEKAGDLNMDQKNYFDKAKARLKELSSFLDVFYVEQKKKIDNEPTSIH